MDAGRVAEFAHPHALLSDASSIFSALVDEMGAETAASLRRAAAEAFAQSQAAAAARAAAAPAAVAAPAAAASAQ